MAKKSRKKSRKSPARRRPAPAARRRRPSRRNQGGFLSSPTAKTAGQAVLGAGLAAAVDAIPAIAEKTAAIPGGSATAVAAVCGVLSVMSKSPKRKKMLGAMAVGAAGFAIVDQVKGGQDWDVRHLAPGMKSKASKVYTLPMTRTAPSKSVEDLLNVYTN